MFNKVILIGNLAKDPELRYTPSGTPVATLRLASSTKYKSGDGIKEDVLFIDCVVWGKQAETVSKFLSKGKSALVEGRLQERRWESDGQQRSKMEIVAQNVRFLGGKGGEKAPASNGGEDLVPEELSNTEPF